MAYNPRYLNIVRPYVFDFLVQVYFQHEPGYGWNCPGIAASVRKTLKQNGLDTEALDRMEIGENMVQAILNEFVKRKLATYHTREEKAGWFSSETVHYYKLSSTGIERVQEGDYEKPHPVVNVQGDIHVGQVESIHADGDVFVHAVKQMVNGDPELRELVQELRELNFQSRHLLGDRVERVLEENAVLKERVRSRGWQVAEFAMAIARIVLG